MTHTGQIIGDWTIISNEWSDKAKARRVRTRCVCGKEFDNHVYRLEAGKSLSCGCRRNTRRLAPFESTYNALKQIAKKRRKDFSLLYTDYLNFTFQQDCFYCGDRILWVARGRCSRKEKPPKGYLTKNLDRKDNTKGYSVENCVVCCGRCNKVKGRFLSFEEMVEVGKILRKFREAKHGTA